MIKRLFRILAFGILLSIANLDCFGQAYGPLNQYTPRPLNEFLASKRSFFKYITLERLQNDANREGKGKVYIQSWLEFPIIAKGDTTRIRYVFDNRVIAHIEIENVGKTTPKDIERGFFDVTVCPEQTTLYKTNIHVKSAKDSIVVLEGVANRRVVVIDGDREEYSRIIFKYQYAAHEKPSGKYRYLNSIAGDVPEGLWVYSPEKLNEHIAEISRVKEEILDTKARLQLETEKFDREKWAPDVNLLTVIEHRVIARGDSTRIKFLFNNRRVRSIKVLGYGKASKEDIKKGEYVVTVAPKKTKLIECYINGGERAHKRVIVIDPEKYDEVMKEWGRRNYNSRYLDKLAGGVPLF